MAFLADLVRLVCLEPMQRVAILERVHRDSGDTQFVGCAKGPDRDLAAIGHQEFGNHPVTLAVTAS